MLRYRLKLGFYSSNHQTKTNKLKRLYFCMIMLIVVLETTIRN